MLATNPVLRGCFPDPSMIRVGPWYYLATSSFEWFPTIPLHRSRDLVHWEHIGSVTTAVPEGSLLGVPDSGGLWAPALSYADGLFWVVYCVVRSVGRRQFDIDAYLPTAHEPTGPWSQPVRIPGHGFDPSLFHHQGRHYLLNLQNDTRVGGRRFDGIVMTELSMQVDATGRVAAASPAAPTQLLLQCEELVEGPKVTYKDGWFYLLLAAGGTGLQHSVLTARSRHLAGPYEVDSARLLTSRDDLELPLSKAGHGELLQAPTGQWFLSHLVSRPVRTAGGLRHPLGRETAVQPVNWVEGWPRLAHGGWQPAVCVHVPDVSDVPDTADVPRVPAGPRAKPTTARTRERRGFADAPGWPWSTLRAPVGDWVRRDGPDRLVLRGRMGPESLWEQSLLAQRLTELRARATVTVTAEPTTFTQSAGLVLWYNTSAYLQLHLTWAEPDGEAQAGQQWAGRGRRVLRLERGQPEGADLIAQVDAPPGPLQLAVNTDGANGCFLAGPPGLGLQQVGPRVEVSDLSDDIGLRFTGTFVGVSAIDLVDAAFTAQFSDWTLRTDSQPPAAPSLAAPHASSY